MGLNKSNGNMYEFVTHTWNPLAGECPHGCSYCSTNKLKRYPGIVSKYSGEIRLHERELNTNLGTGNFIFVAAQNDLFANDVPIEYIKRIITYCSTFNNRYLFQTKNPKRILDFNLPKNSVVCTTIETNRWYPDIMNNSPYPKERAEAMQNASSLYPVYVTIEPILDFDTDEMISLIKLFNPIQVNIGADSGHNNMPEPDEDKLITLIESLQAFTYVHREKNLSRLICSENLVQEVVL